MGLRRGVKPERNRKLMSTPRNAPHPTRRQVLKLGANAPLAALPLITEPLSGRPDRAELFQKILITGAHPDDPETGCGGTITRYRQAGHEVHILYLTRGEAGIPGIAPAEAARIRTQEAEAACQILGAQPWFAGQIDGSTEITPDAYQRVNDIVEKVKPDMIFTHWPIDTHRDHRICSLLTYDAWLNHVRAAAFYYYEVVTGGQTQNFHPSDYVDISPTVEEKWQACFMHESQKIEEYYPKDHAKMEIFRGLENGSTYAEAFIHLQQSPRGNWLV